MKGNMHGYPKVYNLGHKAIQDLFRDPVIVEEKIDGSQFSLCSVDGRLHCRSKGAVVYPEAPNGMFTRAAETATRLFPTLTPGWTYRTEYLQKPKHNALAYDRTPKDYLVIFDIDTGLECYLSYDEKKAEADRIGLEIVPLLFAGVISSPEDVYNLLEKTSFLGGQLVEGIVFKNYARFGKDGKALMGKHVSERFKEVHRRDWGKRNPKQGDVVSKLVSYLKTEARWDKAIQHLRERGELTGTPRDIGGLIAEVKQDVLAEEQDTIMQELYGWVKDSIARGVTAGLAEWYKKKLLEGQFDESK